MQIYFHSIKKNIFIFLATLMILFLTFGFWCGVPLFSIIIIFSEMSLPLFFQFVLICWSVGFCFSLICIPLNLLFAKEYALNKQVPIIKILLKAQGIMIMVVAFVFAIVYLLIMYSVS